ncbi:DUF4956 domain-containing protein [Streptococcaceae bacterium ESL0687]|nr:DUF4956 domain-containing protein [Streptococcaceae bacterium ESL0687]
MLSTLTGVGVALVLGLLIALVHTYRNVYSKNFVITLVTLPVLVQLVIMLVNGNLGTGVAVMGAFSLVRFRSIAGGAREITSIFWSMAIGLAVGTGAYLEAAVFSLVTALIIITLNTIKFGENNKTVERTLKITIAEDLDFPGLFDDILDKYAYQVEMDSVKTTNMGSLYELRYNVKLKDSQDEKKLIDDIRVRNGNLPVSLGRLAQNSEVL